MASSLMRRVYRYKPIHNQCSALFNQFVQRYSSKSDKSSSQTDDSPTEKAQLDREDRREASVVSAADQTRLPPSRTDRKHDRKGAALEQSADHHDRETALPRSALAASPSSSDAHLEKTPLTSASSTVKAESKQLSSAEAAIDKFFKVVEQVKSVSQSNSELDNSGQVLKLEEVRSFPEATDDNVTRPFSSMIRNCKIVSLGEIKDKVVEGKIIEVMDNDLYIDFGGKFHCVCPRPRNSPEKYYRGVKVIVSLQSLEMSSSFLGSDIHITLLEADGILLGLQRRKEMSN